MSYGMHQHNGTALAGIDELAQRIQRCVLTRKGTLVGRRNYGSRLPLLVDNKMSSLMRLDLYSAVDEMFRDAANGLDDFRLKNTQVSALESGNGVMIHITGVYLPENRTVELEAVVA